MSTIREKGIVMSEVARLRAQIEAEYAAAQQGLTGLAAGTARHTFLLARMERTWHLTEQLAGLVGIEEAAAILVEAMEGSDLPQPPGAPS
jgi:hypothetical protein